MPDKSLVKRATGKAWMRLSEAVTEFRQALGPEFDALNGRDRLVIWNDVLKQAVANNDSILEMIDAVNTATDDQKEVA